MGIDASQINSHRADERRLRISMDWFYRIAHTHFKALSLLVGKTNGEIRT
jgi:hypothetical protein